MQSRSSQPSRDWKPLGAFKGLNGFAGAWAKHPVSLYTPVPKVGEGFAVDASLIQADANKQRSLTGAE